MKQKNITWEQVQKIYEQKNNIKLDLPDLSTPELVLKYIEKYELNSASAEMIFTLAKVKP